MDVLEAIGARRSIKRYTERPVEPEVIERLVEVATMAPNHRMTQPWRFYVMGPESRAGFGAALGTRKARRVDDPQAAEDVLRKVEASHRDLPAMLAVSVVLDDNPEIREEDYAATFMAIQNLCLAACALGLGTHVKTGAVMDDPKSRSAVGVPEGERIIATISLGEPAEVPAAKERRAASDVTEWVD
jgi:nitroreductase